MDRPAVDRPTTDRPPADVPAAVDRPAAADRTAGAVTRPENGVPRAGEPRRTAPAREIATPAAGAAPAPRDEERSGPAPFARVDSGPVSFEPTSPDRSAPASDDERPRWPANGVLPRRRSSPTSPDEEAAPERTPRPTTLRAFLRPVPDPAGQHPAGQHAQSPEPQVEEPPREAVVRPLRPAPPDVPAPPPVDPMTDTRPDLTELSHPEPVIDEQDPLGLGRLPLARDEPGGPGDPWSSDWLSGDWAVRAAPSDADRPEEPRSGGSPAAHPAPDRPADRPAPLLSPETTARLDDDDRELLARLQAELAGTSRPAGIAPNGRGPTPPDLAG